MTIANFKALVESWLNRTTGSFTIGTTDCLLAAMNDARRAAQRAHNFELLRTNGCFLATSATGAAWTTGCKTTPGGATAILMKRIDSIWQYATTTIGGSTVYLPTARIRFDTSGDLKRSLPVVDTGYYTVNQQTPFTQDMFGYVIGTNLYVTTVTTSTNLMLFGIQWMDDLTGSESPDIFLTYFTDWFRIATVFFLNTYLKDNERFQIDEVQLAAAFKSMCAMDGDVANMGEVANLD